MHSLNMTKEAIKRDLRPLLAIAESSAGASSLRSYSKVSDLEGAHLALTEAEKIIRNQEERIRQLENLALTDELTGLLNRRGFTLSLQRELAIARRDKNATGVLVMIDLDGFKSINDLWGHGAGDDYLQGVAHALLTEVRANDIVARIGGDEFAILFTHMDEDIGMDRMNRLEKSFNSRAMQWRDKVLPLRASFGLAAYSSVNVPEEVMKSADLRLYAHKARRRAQQN
jgi:diguanylate cyclase (GGDEF)-like protein